MTRVAYKFEPVNSSSFHFGLEGLDHETSVETFPSDSLFAALISTMAEVDGGAAVSTFLDAWPTDQNGQGNPPFRLSSLFPYAGQLLLFPMPRLRVNLPDMPARGVAKFLKKVKYVSPRILNRLISNQDMADWLPVYGKHGLSVQDGRVWLSQDEKEYLPSIWKKDAPEALEHRQVWKTGTAPHVTVDRVSNSGSIYLVGRTVFTAECGVWLLADINNQKDTLDRLLDHLQDKGIGGRRNTGHGAFKLHRENQVPGLPDAAGSPRVMTLSRYSPTRAEIEAQVLGEGASYELVDVGGWLWSPRNPAQRRKRLRMIEAGSLLEANGPVVGRLVDVRPEYEQSGAPDHPVYRNGVALTIGAVASQGGQYG